MRLVPSEVYIMLLLMLELLNIWLSFDFSKVFGMIPLLNLLIFCVVWIGSDNSVTVWIGFVQEYKSLIQ